MYISTFVTFVTLDDPHGEITSCQAVVLPLYSPRVAVSDPC